MYFGLWELHIIYYCIVVAPRESDQDCSVLCTNLCEDAVLVCCTTQ